MREEQRQDGFTEMEDTYRGYKVIDPQGDKIGKVDDLFVDQSGQPEYFGVKLGLVGLKSTLIPTAATTIDQDQEIIVTNLEKDTVKDAPAFDDDEPITPELETAVRNYFGVEAYADYDQRGTYADFQAYDTSEQAEERVQLSEEQLVAGTTQQEAGRVRIRKRVVTEPQEVVVPTKREQVTVERVPATEATATDATIGEQDIEIPLMEERPVVEKRPVVKEEVRIRKDVVEDAETVRENVSREEIDVDGASDQRRAG